MIPHRYNGMVHGLKLIAKEEGFRGLYRGFIAFNLVVSIFTIFLINLEYTKSFLARIVFTIVY
jgi:Mitochondrial carrier protein